MKTTKPKSKFILIEINWRYRCINIIYIIYTGYSSPTRRRRVTETLSLELSVGAESEIKFNYEKLFLPNLENENCVNMKKERMHIKGYLSLNGLG